MNEWRVRASNVVERQGRSAIPAIASLERDLSSDEEELPTERRAAERSAAGAGLGCGRYLNGL